MRVAIIGAGPAGLTAAYMLAKEGVEVEVFESEKSVGGLAKTIELWGHRADLGPHRFFSTDSRVNQLWLDAIGKDYEMIDRLTRMYYQKKFFLYPIQPFDALSKLGFIEATRCVLSYIRGRMISRGPLDSYEDWIVHRFGRRIYEKFFKTYSEKLWGIPCSEIDSDFAAQRLKKFSLKEAIRSAFFKDAKKKHKTLVDQFAYPCLGAGMVYKQMKDFVIHQGGKIYFHTPVKRVVVEDTAAKGVELETGEKKYFDHVISSMPITLLVAGIEKAPKEVRDAQESLVFRNSVFVYLRISAKGIFPDNWIYIHSPELQFGRITNFCNWIPSLCGQNKDTVLCLEYWCYTADEIWNCGDSEMIALAKRELASTGLVKEEQIEDGKVLKIERTYPVYRRGYKEYLCVLENYLRQISSLIVIGRYGSFKYNNQDHSILMGLLAAENIIKNANHNLWEINSDYENYQEASVIAKTGLMKMK